MLTTVPSANLATQNHLNFMASTFVRLPLAIIMVSTLHSLCQECIRKFLGQNCIKKQHCSAEQLHHFSYIHAGIRLSKQFY